MSKIGNNGGDGSGSQAHGSKSPIDAGGVREVEDLEPWCIVRQPPDIGHAREGTHFLADDEEDRFGLGRSGARALGNETSIAVEHNGLSPAVPMAREAADADDPRTPARAHGGEAHAVLGVQVLDAAGDGEWMVSARERVLDPVHGVCGARDRVPYHQVK
ncbi:unnamed protein product [Urochloa humidicola]